MVSPILIPIGGVLLALVLVGLLYSRNYVKVPPNLVAVFTGRGRQKVVRGGARFRMPIIERVDTMELEPFKIEIPVSNVYSKDGVPVNVTAAGMIRFGSTDELIATAVERFLTTPRDEISDQVKNILAGNMRSIVSQMTVEELNGNRDELTRRVLEEASSAFQPIGMQLDVLVIQNISDDNGYLDALGQKRIAEVKRNAAVGQADAERETIQRQAEARRLGAIAEAEAATQIAQAEQQRDIELARISATVERERATAQQAGPLAEAEARRAVVVAEAQVEREAQEAGIAVEQQRALRAEQAAQADTIVPAEAAKTASILRADGERQAAIAAAQAQAEATTLTGNAEASARTAAAGALITELTAQADGEKARLLAQAEGQKQIAEAYGMFTQDAKELLIRELLIKIMPELATQYATQLGKIGNMTVIQNGGSGDGESDMLTQLVGMVPGGIASLLETTKAVLGVDLTNVVPGNGNVTSSSAPASSSTPVVLATPSSDGAVTTE